MKTDPRVLALIALLVCAAFVLMGRGASAPPGMPAIPGERGIHVTGTATVRAEPEMATLTLGYEGEAGSARAARARGDAVMAAVIAAVERQGVARGDVQTVDYLLWRMERRGRSAAWRVTNMVEVRVRNVARAAEALDAATGAGANVVTTVRYEVESLHKLRARGRDEALRIAREKAEQLARSSGVRLGRVVSIRDGGAPVGDPGQWAGVASNSNVAVPAYGLSVPAGGVDGRSDGRLASGMVSVQVHEDVVYAID